MTRSYLAHDRTLPDAAPAFVPLPIPAEDELRGDETVLLVADATASRDVLSSALQCLGYRVIEANHAFAAQTHAHSPIDVLIADLHHGDADGLELARWFRSYQPQLKVLVLTSYLHDFARQVRAGEDFAVLAKPFDLGQFLHMIHLLCERGRVPAPATELPAQWLRHELCA
jgi:CheY-like chemotaxis protein